MSDLHKSCGIAPQDWLDSRISELRAIVTHATAQPILWFRPLNFSLYPEKVLALAEVIF